MLRLLLTCVVVFLLLTEPQARTRTASGLRWVADMLDSKTININELDETPIPN